MATLTKSLLPISGYTNQYYTYKCTVTENSYSIANNTSNVTITFAIKGPWAPSFYEWETYYGIVVDGSVKKTGSSSPYVSTSYLNLLTWTGDIAHNANGSKSISVGVYLYHSGPANYLPKQYTSNSPLSMGSVTLTTIPRSSSITSAGNVTLGNACNIKWTPASSDFKYKIKFALGSWSHTTDFISPASSNAYTYTGYTIPNTSALLDDIPSSTTGTMTATLTTYNSSGSQIGSNSSKTFTVTVPSSVVPTVGTITLDPVNITTANGTSRNILVQGKNKITVSVSGCSAGTGSSIKSYTFSGPNLSTTTTSTSATSNTVTSSGTLTYTVKVTDARGRTASKTATITCYAYTTPYIKPFDAYRCNSSGTKDDNGSYVKCTYTIGYSSVNSTNNATIKIMYKKNNASSYTTVTAASSMTSTSGSYILSNIDTASTYTIYATITDQYSGKSQSSSKTIFSVSRVFNVTSDGTGVAFGKMAESTKLLESKYRVKTPGLLSARDGRITTDINIAADNDHLGCFESFVVKGGNTGVPSLGDGHVACFHWDTTGGYDSQLYLKNSTGEMMSRGCNGGTWGNWRTSLDSSNYTNYASAKPTLLYSTSTGNSGTVTLSSSAANYSYLEIYYTDNNTRQSNSVRVFSPNGKYVSLTCVEPSTSGDEPRIYIRSSGWTISGTTMTPGRTDLDGTPNVGVYGQFYPHANGTNIDVKVTENSYIKIFRVLGYS